MQLNSTSDNAFQNYFALTLSVKGTTIIDTETGLT